MKKHKKRCLAPFDIRQKVVAAATSAGWGAPHVSYVYEADATELMGEFNTLIRNTNDPVTFNIVLLRIIIEGIKAAPRVNAQAAYNKWLASGSVTVSDRIDINMPVLLPDNRTVTVTLPDCGNKSLAELGFCLKRLMEKLKNTNIDIALLDVGWEDTLKKLKRGDLFTPLGRIAGLRLGKNKLKRVSKETRKGYARVPQEARLCNDDLNRGTITISNLGSVIRGTAGFPVLIDLISPQVMAIGIGPLQEKPLVTGGGIAARKILPFCIVFDHRALDFADVAPLIRTMDSVFQGPEIIHRW